MAAKFTPSSDVDLIADFLVGGRHRHRGHRPESACGHLIGQPEVGLPIPYARMHLAAAVNAISESSSRPALNKSALPRLEGWPFLFPPPEPSVSGFSKAKKCLDLNSGVTDGTVH